MTLEEQVELACGQLESHDPVFVAVGRWLCACGNLYGPRLPLVFAHCPYCRQAALIVNERGM